MNQMINKFYLAWAIVAYHWHCRSW